MRFNNLVLIIIGVIFISMLMDNFGNNNSTPSDTADSTGDNSAALKKKGPWPFLSEKQDATAVGVAALRNNIYVVFDGSGSMGERGCSGANTKDVAAKNALLRFSEQIPADMNLGMLVFDRAGVHETVPLATTNREKFKYEVTQVQPSSGTPLKTAITRAYQKLTLQAKIQQGYGNYHLVVVTDGEASSAEDPSSIVNTILAESPVVVHTIGFCIKERHSLNQPGRIVYRSAMNTRDLQAGLSNVLAEAPQFSAAEFN